MRIDRQAAADIADNASLADIRCFVSNRDILGECAVSLIEAILNSDELEACLANAVQWDNIVTIQATEAIGALITKLRNQLTEKARGKYKEYILESLERA